MSTTNPFVEFDLALEEMRAVLEQGAKKHGAGSWKMADNPSLQHKANTASMFRHLAEHHMGVDKDKDSGVDPLLHLACRALMQYMRKNVLFREDDTWEGPKEHEADRREYEELFSPASTHKSVLGPDDLWIDEDIWAAGDKS